MRELTERSRALQDTILRNQGLLAELCERIAEVLNGKVQMPEDQTYVLVPRVYRRPLFLPEIFVAAESAEMIPIPQPMPGPYDPWIVKILSEQRLSPRLEDPDPTPWKPSHDIEQPGSDVTGPDPVPWKSLRDQILADRVLFAELSDAIAETLKKHGVALGEDETYAFDAMMAPKPLFSSQLAATPIEIPGPLSRFVRGKPVRYYHRVDFVTPWEKGIPAPEVLVALEKQRLLLG